MLIIYPYLHELWKNKGISNKNGEAISIIFKMCFYKIYEVRIGSFVMKQKN